MERPSPCRSNFRRLRYVCSTRGIAAAIVVGLACLSGCGARHPPLGVVTGRVTLDGEPVEGASVMFQPIDSGRPASGLTDAQGNYQLKTYELNDGALVGKHRVTIVKQQAAAIRETPGAGVAPGMFAAEKPRWLTPERYARVETSGLEAEVTAGTNQLNFDLVSSQSPVASP